MCWNLARSCHRQGKERKGTRGSLSRVPSLPDFPHLPSSGPSPPRLSVSQLQKRGSSPKRGQGFLRTKASSQPPSLYLSKPQACLIMINCHMDNQIQFPKVGNDTPRTPGRTRDRSLFPGRKGRSSLSPITFSYFNNSKQN